MSDIEEYLKNCLQVVNLTASQVENCEDGYILREAVRAALVLASWPDYESLPEVRKILSTFKSSDKSLVAEVANANVDDLKFAASSDEDYIGPSFILNEMFEEAVFYGQLGDEFDRKFEDLCDIDIAMIPMDSHQMDHLANTATFLENVAMLGSNNPMRKVFGEINFAWLSEFGGK